MKTLAYSLALVALIGAGSASADDGSTGKNMFIGSTDLTSFMAREKAPAEVETTRQAATSDVRDSREAFAEADQDAGSTDFRMTYAN
ncbi:hypothetical protein [Arenibaculum pallidiluteum]|uniref:hypothetical protein n=1 Tax=Arenibaculum pallidiluteum TaxID=2812559 RepID=UPI001A970E8A|nr:hypothetical protein [Arenibaculum pallidiluteum]